MYITYFIHIERERQRETERERGGGGGFRILGFSIYCVGSSNLGFRVGRE